MYQAKQFQPHSQTKRWIKYCRPSKNSVSRLITCLKPLFPFQNSTIMVREILEDEVAGTQPCVGSMNTRTEFVISQGIGKTRECVNNTSQRHIEDPPPSTVMSLHTLLPFLPQMFLIKIHQRQTVSLHSRESDSRRGRYLHGVPSLLWKLEAFLYHDYLIQAQRSLLLQNSSLILILNRRDRSCYQLVVS